MSEQRSASSLSGPDPVGDGDTTVRSGRHLSAAAFGVRAAVLAGLILAGSAAVAGLGDFSLTDALIEAGGAGSTCCSEG